MNTYIVEYIEEDGETVQAVRCLAANEDEARKIVEDQTNCIVASVSTPQVYLDFTKEVLESPTWPTYEKLTK